MSKILIYFQHFEFRWDPLEGKPIRVHVILSGWHWKFCFFNTKKRPNWFGRANKTNDWRLRKKHQRKCKKILVGKCAQITVFWIGPQILALSYI